MPLAILAIMLKKENKMLKLQVPCWALLSPIPLLRRMQSCLGFVWVEGIFRLRDP